MKILQICNKIPYPVVDGGTAAMHQLGQGLSMLGHEVKILAIHTPKQNFQEQKLSAEYLKTYNPEYVFLDTSVKPIPAFLNLFSSESYNIKRFDSPILRSVLSKILQNEKYDIVLLDSLFVTPYIDTIRNHSSSKIILRAHNVEHLVWERNAAIEKNSLKKRYLNFLAKRLKNYELQTIKKLDGVAAISLSDLDYFKQSLNVPTEYIPFGYNVKSDFNVYDFINDRAYFLGSMDWSPNHEALIWILENIFPVLESLKNSFHITVAGNKMPAEFIQKTNKNFEVKGKIDNPEKFIEQFGVLIAPIFSGGGLKIKVVEAMANGKLVITTPIGAEGLGAIENVHFLLCKTKEEFISAIQFCLVNKQKASEIAQRGQDFIRENYGLEKIYSKLNKFMSSV
ncbi:MAG: glycosyltransferase family 4 protein [Bacteroidota bacterium]|jgi:glycosyltransferase involved in cell wall biosynthesis